MTTRIRAGFVVTAMNLVNVAVGLLAQSLLASQLGISSLSDDFQLAWAIVTFGALIFFSMVTSYFVPRMHPTAAKPIPIGGIWIPIAFGFALMCIQIAWAILDTSRSGISQILLWSSPVAVIASLAALSQVFALLERRFILASVGAVANGLGLLAFLLVVPRPLSGASLGQALAIGYVCQLSAVGLPLLFGRIRISRDVSIRLIPFLGVAGFTLIAKFQPVVERIVAISVYSGSTTALGLGQKVAQGLLLLSSFGLAFTSIAIVSEHINANNVRRAGSAIAETLATTLLFCSIVTAYSIGLIRPVVELIFEHGSFTAGDTTYVTEVVYMQIPWVMASAVSGVLTNYLYVARKYARVIWASLIGIFATIIISGVIAPFAPQFAVVIASSCASVLSLGWLGFVVWQSDISYELVQELTVLKPMIIAIVCLLASAVFSAVIVRFISFESQWIESACCLGGAALVSACLAMRKDVRVVVARALTAHV